MRIIHKNRSCDPNAGAETRWGLWIVGGGGAMDMRNYPRVNSSGGGTPRHIATDHRRLFSLSLGIDRSMIEAGNDKETS